MARSEVKVQGLSYHITNHAGPTIMAGTGRPTDAMVKDLIVLSTVPGMEMIFGNNTTHDTHSPGSSRLRAIAVKDHARYSYYPMRLLVILQG